MPPLVAATASSPGCARVGRCSDRLPGGGAWFGGGGQHCILLEVVSDEAYSSEGSRFWSQIQSVRVDFRPTTGRVYGFHSYRYIHIWQRLSFILGAERQTRRWITSGTQAEAAGFKIDQVDLRQRRVRHLFQAGRNARKASASSIFLRPGDTLVVGRMDRLGRDYRDVSDSIRHFMRDGVLVKTVINGMVFDRATKDPIQQAVQTF